MYIERFSGTEIGFLGRFYVILKTQSTWDSCLLIQKGVSMVFCTFKICKNTSLMTKKYVKNYQNKLFFVPNLGVKLVKTKMGGLDVLLKLFAFDPSGVL